MYILKSFDKYMAVYTWLHRVLVSMLYKKVQNIFPYKYNGIYFITVTCECESKYNELTN